jgi:hypothetical protein
MPSRVRPSIIPEYRQGFRRWRALVFMAAATTLFVVIALAITAYFGFSRNDYVDTESVPPAAAERFGRFILPPGAADFRAQTRGTPLSGELMARFRFPASQLPALLSSTELSGDPRPDRTIERQLASVSDRRWWWSPLRPANDSRTFLAAGWRSDTFTQLLLIDTTPRPPGSAQSEPTYTAYLYASNR